MCLCDSSITELFLLEYHKTDTQESSSGQMSGILNDDDDFQRFIADSVQASTNDLERYLADPLLLHQSDNSFSILDWWKSNQAMYPDVASMARDVLAIPASTVASESVSYLIALSDKVGTLALSIPLLQAFSTGGRVLDDFRSLLKAETVEALICTQDWLRKQN
jgi:hypothetical protein